MTPESPLPSDSRREFVRKSLAASIIAAQPTLLAGLVRAEGSGGDTTGTTDPWETTYETTVETTIETTGPETTETETTTIQEYEIIGSPKGLVSAPGQPANTTGYNCLDISVASTPAATLKIETWVDPDNKSYTKVKVRCRARIICSGKDTHTEEVWIEGKKANAAAAKFSEVKTSPVLNPPVVNVPWNTTTREYHLGVGISATRNDPAGADNDAATLTVTCVGSLTVFDKTPGGLVPNPTESGQNSSNRDLNVEISPK